MTDYTKSVDFAAKDLLSSGDPSKIIKGTEFGTEFDNIEAAILTKANIAGPTFTGTTTIPTVDINGGAIDAVTLGINSAITQAQIDNININGNTISSSDTNGNVNISPNGTGTVVINTDLDVDNINVNGNTVSSTDTNGNINLSPNGTGSVVINTDLDVDNININGNAIISTDTNGNIDLTPNGTGEVNISKVDINSGAIDGTTVGAANASTGAFTTLTASTSLNIASSTTVDGVLDEDTMSSNSATKLATQQSIKAYVDSQVGANNELSEVLANGNTTGGTDIAVGTGDDITFADSSKAIFGAGSDLQIYHDASNSIINDNGTGNLRLQTGGSTKLEVTTTGIDVTGTVTADGLTVDGDGAFNQTDTRTYSSTSPSADLIISRKNTSNVSGQTAGIRFDVTGWSGSTTGGAAIEAIQPSNASTADLAFLTRDAGTWGERMRISSGNVGIGTTSPNNRIDAVEAQATVANVLANGTYVAKFTGNTTYTTGASQGILIGGVDGSLRGVALVAEAQSALNDHDFIIAVSGTSATPTERMRIDASGRVGIGVVPESWLSSYDALQIGASGALSAISSGNENVGLSSNAYLATDGNFKYIATNEATRYLQSAGVHYWYTAASGTADTNVTFSQNMTLDASGNLLVGTTSASGASAPDNSATAGDAGIRMSPSGFIGLGANAAPSGYFNRINTDGDIVEFRKDGSKVGSISVTASATTYNTSSDQRLKENIVDAPSASDDIDAIQVRSFDWKADGSHQKYGMVAQELVTVAPEAVSQPEDPEEMMGVDYSKLVPMLIKEVQQLRARVAQLEGAN